MLLTVAHLDVHGFDFVSTGEDTSTGNTTEDVGTSTLHQGHKSFRFQDLDTAVKGGFVVDTLKRGLSYQQKGDYPFLPVPEVIIMRRRMVSIG